MILIIYFDDWYLKEQLKKNLVKRLTKHGIKFTYVYYSDLETFLLTNKKGKPTYFPPFNKKSLN